MGGLACPGGRELSLGSRDDVVVKHVGTNDLRRMRQNELIQRYESVVRSLREKTDKVLVKSVLPRPWDGAAGVELVRTINRSLRTICERVGAKYVDLYPHFDGVPGIFMDGLHLKGWGAATLGRILKKAVVNLCSSGPDVRLNSQPDRGARAPTLGIWLLGGLRVRECVLCTYSYAGAGWLTGLLLWECLRTYVAAVVLQK